MAAKVDRRSMLFGTFAGVTMGGGVGFLSGSISQRGATSNAVLAFEGDGAKQSYAQQGEDLVVEQMLGTLGIAKPSYVDIGAQHPSINNNTYLFYKAGGRGLLVEPNPTYAQLLRERRSEDTVLEAGIGVTNATEADYYVMAGDGQLNTFSKEQADELVKLNGPQALVKVIKRPLFDVNEVFAKHFTARPPDFLSIDVEGLDFDILKTLDFDRFRPKLVCVETCLLDGELHAGIMSLMAAKGYAARGGSFVNTVFVDERARRAHTADAGPAHRD
jgi:FkbM family methyltransferase